jgi:ribosomal protein S18 acetylase RimI-like enzyme
MTIRPLRKSDAAAYRRLRIGALKESPTAFGSSHAQEGRMPIEFFQQRIDRTRDRWVLGAFDARKLIGVVGFVRDSGVKTRHKGFIWGMYVDPAFRAQGVGRALFQAAMARVDSMPRLRWVRLSVTVSNAIASRLYEQFGFSRYGEEPESLFVGGRYYAEYHMVRRVHNAQQGASGRRRP